MASKIKTNVSLSEEVKDWYQEEAKKYGMSMIAMLSFTLTKHYEDSKKLDRIAQASELIKDAKENGINLGKDQPSIEQIELMSEFMKNIINKKTD